MYKKLAKNLQRGKELSGDGGDIDGCLKERAEAEEKIKNLIIKLWKKFPVEKYFNHDQAISDFVEENRKIFGDTIPTYFIRDVISEDSLRASFRERFNKEYMESWAMKQEQQQQLYYQNLIRTLKGEK